jgi:hypothetical protein
MAFGVVSEAALAVDTTLVSLCFGAVSCILVLLINLRGSRFRVASSTTSIDLAKRLCKWLLITYLATMILLILLSEVLALVLPVESELPEMIAILGLWYSIWISLAIGPELAIAELRRLLLSGEPNDA